MSKCDRNRSDRGRENFTSAFTSLSLFRSGPEVFNLEPRYNARFEFGADILHLFPYINAEVTGTQFFTKPSYVKFIHDERLCILYPSEGAFTPVKNKADAYAFLENLLAFLQDIAERKAGIAPDYRQYSPISALEILKILPKTNCRACGFATCLAFAAALSCQQTIQMKCPHLPKPVAENSSFKVVDDDGREVHLLTLPINTSSLYQNIEQKELQIKSLQDRLAEFEMSRASIEENNAKLLSPLTKRELEVLELMARGQTNREIAGKIGISEHTVKSHVNHVFDKLGVNDRAQAAVWAVKNGLL